MKKLLLFTLIFCHACMPHPIKTYEQGLENCNKIVAAKMKENPSGFLFPVAECLVGYQLPDFETKDINGNTINKEKLKGKLSIINFWFMSCPPCVAEIPGFNKIVEKYGKDRINFLAIGKDGPQDITDFLKDHPWQFDQIADGTKLIEETFKSRWGYPTTFLVNEETEILLAFTGGKSDSSAVEDIQNKLIPVIDAHLKK